MKFFRVFKTFLYMISVIALLAFGFWAVGAWMLVPVGLGGLWAIAEAVESRRAQGKPGGSS